MRQITAFIQWWFWFFVAMNFCGLLWVMMMMMMMMMISNHPESQCSSLDFMIILWNMLVSKMLPFSGLFTEGVQVTMKARLGLQHTRCLAGSSKVGMQLYLENSGACARSGLEMGLLRIPNNFMVHHACSSEMVVLVDGLHVWTNGSMYMHRYNIYIYI